jgi:hypothetical protein
MSRNEMIVARKRDMAESHIAELWRRVQSKAADAMRAREADRRAELEKHKDDMQAILNRMPWMDES